jgi:hypothetical protein
VGDRRCARCIALSPEPTPLVIDFTTSQVVYETGSIPRDLLRWRAVVGQKVVIILPVHQLGDSWRVRSITTDNFGSWPPSLESDAFGADSYGPDFVPDYVPAKTCLDHAGQAFSLASAQGGKFFLELHRSNPINGHDTFTGKLELNVLWPSGTLPLTDYHNG